MQKISLIAAINAASQVVCGGYEIDEFGTPAGADSRTSMTLICSGVEEFEFDDQEVELDTTEGVVTAVDRDGNSYDISLMVLRPLSVEDLRRRAEKASLSAG